MDDKRTQAVGRVRSFDSSRRSGVVGDVGGGSYWFELTDDDSSASALVPGQLVTFDVAGAARVATGVRRRTAF